MNDDLARLALDRLAATRQLVQALAFELQRRMHRRHLLLLAQERRQHGIDGAIVQRRHRGALDHLRFAVTRLGALAELHEHAVGLAGVQQPTAHLGRLPEADRQQAGRERIEAAGMPGLGRAEQRARLLQSRVGRDTERLVEQQDAADGAMEARRTARDHGLDREIVIASCAVFVVDVTRRRRP